MDDDGYVTVDAKRINALCVERGWSGSKFAQAARVAPNTAYRCLHGKRIQIGTARQLFDNLAISDMRPFLLLRPDAAGQGPEEFDELDAEVLAEWRVDNVMTKPTTLSNGLSFHACKLAHRLLPDTWGRGKCYDLQAVVTRDSSRIEEQLLRHPVVCRSVQPHPRFPVNERVLYNENRSRFWVIDRWFDGITLEDKLSYGPLPPAVLPAVMRQILEGLEVLHQRDIIRRELSPRYVALVEPDGGVLLTELELAKLLEGGVSVSEAWDEDPYRAPEIESPEIDRNVDLYSWAQILVHAATGQRPPSPAKPDLLEGAALPEPVRKVAKRCLSLSYRHRPDSVQEVQRALRRWH